MEYTYVAYDGKNVTRRGTVEARTIREATQQLYEQGWFIKSIRPASRSFANLGELSFGGISLVERMLFTRHLAMMLKSGLSLTEALDAIGSQTSSRPFRKVVADIISRIRAGQSLAASLEQHPKAFDALYVNIIKVGEESGTLEENLDYLAKNLEDRLEFRRRIQSASFYPAIIFSATVVLVLVLSKFVLPNVTKLFRSLKVELPITTKIMLGASQVIDQYGAILFIILVALIIGLRLALRVKAIRKGWHWFLLRLPIFGRIVTHYNLVTLNRTMAILLKAGLPIDRALTIASGTGQNIVYRQRLERSVGLVQKGTPLSQAFISLNPGGTRALFPLLMTKMIGVGERSGRLDESFAYVAEYFEKEVDATMQNLTVTLEPILLLTIGGIIGLVAISVITPIYQVTGQFRR